MIAVLGNNTKSCNPPHQAPDYESRYALQSKSANLLPKERVGACCRALIRGENTVNVIRHPVSGTLSYGNLIRCGSVWMCPVCASKIVAHRRSELAGLIDRAVESGVFVSMLTLTIPHGISDSLEKSLSAISKAKRLMQNRKPFKRWAASVGLFGDVRCLEITHGVNGWHPHFHILFFTKTRPKMTGITSAPVILLAAWQDACETAGLACPNHHGCNLVIASKGVSDYVQKFGMDYEMTYANNKTGAGRSPFKLLSDSVQGCQLSSALFVEYAKLFKGKRQLVFSKGLKKMFSLDESIADELLVHMDPVESVVVYTISRERWKLLVKHNQRGVFLAFLHKRLELDVSFAHPCGPPIDRLPF